LISTILSIILLSNISNDAFLLRFTWMPGFELGWNLDRIGVSLMALVSFISMLVHLFSINYMENDPGIGRYYAKLGFFTFSMLGLLGADHLLLLFIFWELVGFSSYLLIGFWYKKEGVSYAARIAFITNRVADAGFLIGILIIIVNTGTGFISEFQNVNDSADIWLKIAGFGLILGSFGKSAQFPFYTWLPRAMAGPTPVSALIHAATMVAAGVYLLVRINILLMPSLLEIVAIVGAFTAFVGAFSALSQTDIKKVLAYSTISQLGYMVMGVGVGARDMALFHLWTHAFFKAGLFLSAGAIIHYLHKYYHSVDAQDMRVMGNLRSVLPTTTFAYVLCTMSLAGLPFFSGFLSKDGILLVALEWSMGIGSWSYFVPVLGFVTVILTAFYMGKQAILVFFGSSRLGIDLIKEKESLFTIKLPLIILAIGSLGFFYSFNPFSHHFQILVYCFGNDSIHEYSTGWLAPITSIVFVFAGILIAVRLFTKDSSDSFKTYEARSNTDKLSLHALYLDQLYHLKLVKIFDNISELIYGIDRVIIDPTLNFIGQSFVVLGKLMDIFDKVVVDKLVNFTAYIAAVLGDFLRLFHGRRVQLHLFWAVLGMILILIWINNY